MSQGRLAALDVTPVINNTLYNPALVTATVTVSMVNRSPSAALVRVALSTTAVPTVADWLEYDAYLPTSGVLERSAIVVGPGQFLVVQASAAGVSAVAFGFEE